MSIILWIAQVVLALGMLSGALMKFFQPADKLAQMWPWTANNHQLVIITGILDLLACIGLILPALLRIRPCLTIYAAYGTMALMVAASVFHIYRGEASKIGINIFFLLLALFIAWGRKRIENTGE